MVDIKVGDIVVVRASGSFACNVINVQESFLTLSHVEVPTAVYTVDIDNIEEEDDYSRYFSPNQQYYYQHSLEATAIVDSRYLINERDWDGTINDTPRREYKTPPIEAEIGSFEPVEAFSITDDKWHIVYGKYVRKFWLYPDGDFGDGGYGEYTKWRRYTK